MSIKTIGMALDQARLQLGNVADQPGLEAQLLLSAAINKRKEWLLIYPDAPLNDPQLVAFDGLLQRRLAGEPLPYILGKWEFYGREFLVDPRVLIPRPETECIVEAALEHLAAQEGCGRVLDVGTGSGIIAVSLACERPMLDLIAVDCSYPALQLAEQNAQRYNAQRSIRWICMDLTRGLDARFDVVAANLPYIPTKTLRALPVSKHEPWNALDGGQDGLDMIRDLVLDLPRLLVESGIALLEIEAGQGEAALGIAQSLGPSVQASIEKDLAGHDRLLRIRV